MKSTDLIKELKEAVLILELADARLDSDLSNTALDKIKNAISFKGETLSFADDNQEIGTRTVTDDPINPSHYKDDGLECIEIAEVFPFNIGNAIKYVWRAGLKGDLIEDLKKCKWYCERAILNADDYTIGSIYTQAERRIFNKLNEYLQDDESYRSLILVSLTRRDVDHAIEYLDEYLEQLEKKDA